ncbi:hypothetical protein EJ05DRAFT_89427 [Pseudovirgaria hyperparasitica]|uniref:Proteophosphoglycan 5 n=1 Tax=Pseudovirgaria hyperparasitica TaxID=470096 RepID=A0A6A6W1Y0_9PEZI|nr:uncharacterized protein EJ05DRAFT_89427 [Pseudovirgaria hyperparasitica]KAF2756086.1 hypothetical protein EJ05DRAFT_89427 [Pseudovirgaria hyperparasitica]
MSTKVLTPPQKAPRVKHHNSTDETIGEPNTSHTTPVRSNRNRQKSNKHNHDQNYHSESQVVDSNTDVENQTTGNVTDDGVAGSESAQNMKRKRPPKPKRSPYHGNEGYGSPPYRHSGHAVVPEPVPATTPGPKPMAYAGPTFHASPAPSTLPKPRFFSKSVPADVNESGLQARMEADQRRSPPPVGEEISVPPRNEESPLDFLFNSDREQKAKRSSGVLTPNSSTLDRTDSRESSFGGLSRQHNRQPSAGSGRLFPIELEGSDANASRHGSHPRSPNEIFASNRSRTSPSTLPRARNPYHDQENMTQSLKAKLFGPPGRDPQTGAKATPIRSDYVPEFHSPSPFNRPGPGSRSTSGPATPVQQQQDQVPMLDTYHYGNRNLSPLFKAAQGDTRQRSSGLRQEIASPQQPRYSASSRDAVPTPTSPGRFGPLPHDVSAFSRNYLKSHISNASPIPGGHQNAYTQPVPRYSNPSPSGPLYKYHASSVDLVPNLPDRAPYNPTQPTGYRATSAGASASPDVQDMESRLRQMLNLSGSNGSNTGLG